MVRGVLGTLRRSCACGEGEIAMQPPPGWLARKFLLQQPYPVLDWDELDREPGPRRALGGESDQRRRRARLTAVYILVYIISGVVRG